MLRICRFLPIFLGFILIISTIPGYTLTNEATINLETALSAYSKALQESDTDTILNAIPPQIIDSLATKRNLNKLQFQRVMKSQIEHLASNYKIESININQTERRAGKLNDNIPYFIIPMHFTITKINGKKCHIQTEIIALFENNQWYFIRGSDKATLHMVNKAFPGFETIKINPTKITKIP
ncbi:hypothetical protein H704_00656 [Bartonella bacilliformis Peru38]|uniref:Uncharacterized protein n=2 Tax=Bartonella bacilliformis TaxID=774 RepID=A1USS8_BARBK|nr:hypothetical protein [Bartonella bacilliformis]ABM45415.1 conserved hypothetical protein [Bartonella bacilliformis KC583]AMG85835.1 hypothetical protein AL467_03530 [Bartonella bacilliformis]EKS44185.1 hypothetical protein BbINS_03457 [Bartonella bacilliformis INS]EYS89967.1 hypothetical protein X472_00418 [Bartonella bacilliformis San Pedro600-02]EYS95310.1 hypothetical protein X470_00838 [Bartonella bacilliformis Peru-18]